MIETIDVQTQTRTEFVDITAQIHRVVQNVGVSNGVCYVFVPHTTAGVTINENADPDVQRDMIMEMNKIVPFEDRYAHYEGNSAAHIKASLFGSSVTVFVENGAFVLGRWQGIYFCEFDGPRHRNVCIKVIEG